MTDMTYDSHLQLPFQGSDSMLPALTFTPDALVQSLKLMVVATRVACCEPFFLNEALHTLSTRQGVPKTVVDVPVLWR